MHLEYVVLGPPVSNQQSNPKGKANLSSWKVRVAAQAKKSWKAAPLTGKLKALIINFHDGDKPSLDTDNMSKPVFDCMNKLVYADDRQIRQAELVHVPINSPMAFVKVSKLLVDAVQAGEQFVYIRIEDPVDPCPLPK